MILRNKNRLFVPEYSYSKKWNAGSSSWYRYCSSSSTTSLHSLRSNNRGMIYVALQLQKSCNNNNNNQRSERTTNQVLLHSSHRQSIITRQNSNWASSLVPFDDISIWGGSGYLLKLFHFGTFSPCDDGSAVEFLLPYWGCFIALSVLVRALLVPAVIYGARTSARFAKVVPEVQFLLSLFRLDMKQLNAQKNPPPTNKDRWRLALINMKSLSGIYKLHSVRPFAIFLSPLLQLPIFWYISIDMRKIVNGLDPALAQDLVDTTVAWIPDLTSPDPWYGLPIMAGLAMYGNIEIALGKQNLAGSAASKTDTAVLLKDAFQSLAIFMPCFTCHLPAGVQIYIVTSFVYTIFQSAALRTDAIRSMIGLPLMSAKPAPPKYATEFIELKQLEQRARELRRPGTPLLGKGVLAYGLEVSFAGSVRPSTIQGSIKPLFTESGVTPASSAPYSALPKEILDMPFIHGISAPLAQLIEQQQQQERSKNGNNNERNVNELIEEESLSTKIDTTGSIEIMNKEDNYMPEFDDDIIDKANRGDRSILLSLHKKKHNENVMKDTKNTTLSLKRFQTKQSKPPKKTKKKR